MAYQTFSPISACNNDRMGHLTAFRVPGHTTAAAPALASVPPSPTALNEDQAREALQAVQHEVSQGQQGNALDAVHSGLDADRVARLLGLLG